MRIGQEECTGTRAQYEPFSSFSSSVLIPYLKRKPTYCLTPGRTLKHNITNKVIMVQHCWQDYDSVNGKILFGNNTGTGQQNMDDYKYYMDIVNPLTVKVFRSAQHATVEDILRHVTMLYIFYLHNCS